jgi:hypothetical protein
MSLAQIFAECGNPKEVQTDGEGVLTNDIVSDFFADRGIHVIKTEGCQKHTCTSGMERSREGIRPGKGCAGR